MLCMCVCVCLVNWESLNGYQWLLEQQQQHHRKINWFMSSRRRDVIILTLFCCAVVHSIVNKNKPPNPCNLMSFDDLHGKRAQHAKKSNLLYHSQWSVYKKKIFQLKTSISWPQFESIFRNFIWDITLRNNELFTCLLYNHIQKNQSFSISVSLDKYLNKSWTNLSDK